MNIIDSLKWRYAVKEFDNNGVISDDKIEILKDAFSLTASSFGLQPWKMFIIRHKKIREKLVEHSWGQRQVVDSSDLLILARPNNIDEEFVDSYIKDIIRVRGGNKEELQGYSDMMNGFLSRMSPEAVISWANNQIYIALGNLTTVCATMNIDTCPMEGFIPEKYDEILGLKSKGYTAVSLLPIGYRSENDKYAKLKKVRFEKDIITEEL